MKTICAWCDKHISGEESDIDISHGSCQQCLDEIMGKAKNMNITFCDVNKQEQIMDNELSDIVNKLATIRHKMETGIGSMQALISEAKETVDFKIEEMIFNEGQREHKAFMADHDGKQRR